MTSPPVGRLDGPECVRGASNAFSILIVGGVLQTVILRTAPSLAAVWLPLVSVIGYSVAGQRIGMARLPALHGMAAAICAWLLVLPLRILGTGLGFVPEILVDLGIAGVVGATAGLVGAGIRKRRTTERTAL